MPKVSKNSLVVDNLHARIGETKILHGVSLVLRPGKVTALMGPNGSGKSTLANVIMGNPDVEVTRGKVMWQGKNILKLSIDERARMGLFLSFQYPTELPGVNMYEFLTTSYKALHGEKAMQGFDDRLQGLLKKFKLSSSFLDRNVNEGFSGGEKKKNEMLQLALFDPKIAIMDETDSGLDIDALKLIAKNVNDLRNTKRGFLVITHYQRLLKLLKPDAVHVMHEGKIVKTGTAELVKTLERKGYNWINS
ncbi:MAG: Fe-S cluster assembly ATPase SufC [Patescibacteria group bacterium]